MSTSKKGTEIVAEFFAAFGRRDLDAVQSFFAEDIVYTVIGDPAGDPPLDKESREAIPWLGRYNGPEGARKFIAQLQRNIEVIGFGPQEVVDGGDVIVVFGTFSYRAVSTGRRFDSDYAIRIKLRGDKFAEYTFFENTYAVAAAFRKGGNWELEHDDGVKIIPAIK